MSTPLLSTKLSIPPLRARHIGRARLVEHLEQGLRQGGRLTLISAPAGYGKTTLLVEWIEVSGRRAAWIALDEGDNDFVRFSAYLTAALHSLYPGSAAPSSAALPQPDQPLTVEALLAPLINDLAGAYAAVSSQQGWQQTALLVLDDCHLIQTQAVHDALAFLCEYLPPQVHLVIATRADLPLPVARLRGRGQVTEVRLNELRFTTDEAAQFLEMLLGAPLAAAYTDALTVRTEGWAAGLQMAAVSLQGRQDIAAFIDSFTGSHRYILDYLIEEVLLRQPQAVQQFLVGTSFLERLCGPLCDAVLEQSGGQAILENLEHANLFILPLDERRAWYRYHRLFADLLQARLAQSQPGLLLILARRAAGWCEEHNLLEEAIEYALQAGDTAWAANLVERAAEAVLMRSEMVTFLKWLERLPEAELRQRPILNVYQAWALLWGGASLEAVEKSIARISADGVWPAQAGPLRAILAAFRGQIDQTMELTRQALQDLPEDAALLRGITALIQAKAYLASDENEASIQALEEVARSSERTGNRMASVMVLCSLGELYQKQGRLHQAQDYYRRALELATDPQGKRLPIAGIALNGLSDLAREWNDLEGAERMLRQGIELCGNWSLVGTLDGQLNLALLLDLRGDFTAAQEIIQRMRRLAQQFDAMQMDDYIVDWLEARLNVRHGNLEAVRRWASQRGLAGERLPTELEQAEDMTSGRMRKYEYTVLARLLLVEGRYEQALRLLEHLVSQAQKSNRPILMAEAEMLAALVYQAQGQMQPALENLEHALRRAEPEGLLRTFLDEGESVHRLLAAFRQAPVSADPALLAYADHLLEAFGDRPAAPPIPSEMPTSAAGHAGETLLEPLSERELEVLRLLTSSLSTRQMADKLCISANTLRSHLKSVYAKLDAHSRYEALSRARELKLLA